MAMLVNLKAKLVPAKVIEVEGKTYKTHGNGFIVLRVGKENYLGVRDFLKKFYQHKDWKRDWLEFGLRVWYKKRSLDQNNLMWALLTILSVEVYGEFGHEETLYQDMLNMFAPRITSKLTGNQVVKSSSKCNTVEMARIIEGIFRELAELGVSLENAEAIKNYWVEWYRWRGEQKSDPIEYKTIQEYKEGVNYCEGCLTYLGKDQGQVAHIVSSGSGGINTSDNLLRLCNADHLMLQHQEGWEKLIGKYPHLRWKVDKAREAQGKKELFEEEPKDEQDPSEWDSQDIF